MALPQEDPDCNEANDPDSLLGDADDFVEFDPMSQTSQESSDIVDDDLELENDNNGPVLEPEI